MTSNHPAPAPTEHGSVHRALRTPRSAAAAGIAFSVLFTITLLLIHAAAPHDPSDGGEWLADESHRDVLRAALGLVPFAGIAFLWFVGVVRDRVGDAEDRFFATVFLGSGLLFVAMLFASAAAAGALVASVDGNARTLSSSGAWDLGRNLSQELLVVYAVRMAAVFMIATSTILLRTGNGPSWLTGSGYASGLLILVTAGLLPWIELLFPVWLLVLSLHILVASFASTRSPEGESPPTG